MTDIPTLLASTAGVCASLGAIFYSIKRTLRFVQKASNGFDAITALSEEIKPGEFQDFKTEVLGQIRHNGGGSIKGHQNKQTEDLAAIREMLTGHVNNADIHIVRGTD